MSCLEAWAWVSDVNPEPLYVGVDVDSLLPRAKPPGTGPKCKEGHLWHLLPDDPKYTAYCERCPAKTTAGMTGERGRERVRNQPLPPHREECEPGKCCPKCKCPDPPPIAA